jgi:threonine dehydratase
MAVETIAPTDDAFGGAAIAPSDEMIAAAVDAGRGIVKHTPVTSSAALSERCGGDVVLKAENLQRTGSFKIRGAINKVASLGAAARPGVTAGSAGNHAQALAFAARHAGVRCEIFVPHGAPISKMEACVAYGAVVVEGGDTVDDAVASARARATETGMAFCHPFDDLAVVAGQATMGLELLADLPDLAQVIIPLGGGGLASGTAIAIKRHRPDVEIVAVQVAACAPYADRPPAHGPIVTLADGIAVKRPGAVTAPLVEQWVDDVVVVEEDAVADAMTMLMERSKMLVEGAGAVGVAALLAGAVTPARLGTTCVVLSGGNVDLGMIPGLIRRTETQRGRRIVIDARVSDRPGGLARLLSIFAGEGANLIDVVHLREGVDLDVRETAVQAVLEVRSPDHATRVLASVLADGFEASARHS